MAHSKMVPPVLVIAGTSSGVGKTTVACGLMAAFVARGLCVQPFKVGPDFLDGKHHEQVCSSRPSINLDGWMMGGKQAVLDSFHRHAHDADICIVEGVMGLHDSKDGVSDDGSTAQIAKWLQAPVLLVVDAHSMARSVAAMVLGYLQLDTELRLSAVVVNKVSGKRHIQWILEALNAHRDRIIDVGTNQPILFAGAMPKDRTVVIPERHLGLVTPSDTCQDEYRGEDQYAKLAGIIQEHLDLDGLLDLARSATPPKMKCSKCPPSTAELNCRVGVARDEAFSFYYADNFKLLQDAGAELFFFSPVHDKHLPPCLDAIYIGGGYPELYAQELQQNASLRKDIRSFSEAGGVIYAECGGLMYLSAALWTMTKNKSTRGTYDRQRYDMCNVLSDVVVSMTPHMKMGYAEIEMTDNPIFRGKRVCRGQEFHFSEVVEEMMSASSPFLVTPQHDSAKLEKAGYSVRNAVASYFHLHWTSNPSLAHDFVESAMRTSPTRKMFAVSFVSSATEIAFSLGAGGALAGVTSVCDWPAEAQAYPRQVVCRSPFDASTMTSEEVATAMMDMKIRAKNGPPGHWLVDKSGLAMISPQVAFVQESCEICDAAKNDVMFALEECDLIKTCETVQVSPITLEEMLQSIVKIGAALGVPQRSVELCGDLRRRLEVVAEKVEQLKTKRPTVLSLEGLAPLCVGGNWLSDVKAAAGCDDALGDTSGSAARILSWSDVENADPDVLILSPCSATISRTLNELHLVNTAEFWKLRCVRNGDVYVIDHRKFSKPGPRLVDGIEQLATLLRGVSPPPDVDIERDWKNDVLKYECCVGIVKHCTTELSARFKPYFGDQSLHENVYEADKCVNKPPNFRRIRATRCSLPEQSLPCDRSAHHMLALKDGSVIMFAGENSAGFRLSDLWKLSPPSHGWDAKLDAYDNTAIPQLGRSPVWEFLQCSKVADEEVPSKRSNSAVVVCGDYLLVFGGWGVDSECLDNCELLHLDSLCWTHCSIRGSTQPSPRGNPTFVYRESTNTAILFGGWNKVNKLSELWFLNMKTWEWNLQAPGKKDAWPQGRTDHSSVVWSDSSGKEVMLVFGGSVEGQECSSELWILDLVSNRWNAAHLKEPSPAARTSHSAAVAGHGNSASMIVVGGTGNGSGRSVILADAWMLSLESMTWTKLSWSGSGVARCRLTIAVVDGGTVLVWGGYDGAATVQDDASLWVGNITAGNKHITSVPNERKQLQERWQAEVPLRESDLPAGILAKAKASSLPGALFKALHRNAVTRNRDTYIDPATGYSVFTQLYLKRRSCCGNACRHCPYGHANVVQCAKSEPDAKLEW